MNKKRVLGGLQPTGCIHLGNYLGAIRDGVRCQEKYELYLCVVDINALSTPFNPKTLTDLTYQAAALYLACGINPSHTTIFIQSHILLQSRLTWLLNCITPLKKLEQMTHFQEKALKQGENLCIGILDEPVNVSADILLYQADLILIGVDQNEQLELTQYIANRFNELFAKNSQPILKIPEAPWTGFRVMSLIDGTCKMSKSDPSDSSRINLLDSPELIQSKIENCKIDSMRGLTFDNPQRPECHNLLTIYQLLTGKIKEEVVSECQDMDWIKFKHLLTETIITTLVPIQDKYYEIIREQSYLESVLHQGRQKAELIARKTLTLTEKAMGIPSQF